MTDDSKLFPPRQAWENKGYRPDEYSRWIQGDWRPISELWAEVGVRPLVVGERRCAQPPYDMLPVPRAELPEGLVLARDAGAFMRESGIGQEMAVAADGDGGRVETLYPSIALPLYVGRMVFLNEWAAGLERAVSGGRADLEPDLLLAVKDLRHDQRQGMRLVFRDVSNSSNQRTFIAALIPPLPVGNVLPGLRMPDAKPGATLELVTSLSSLVFDWAVRQRMSGTHLNWHIVQSLALPAASRGRQPWLGHAARLNLSGAHFSPEWLGLRDAIGGVPRMALSPHERLRLTVLLDAVTAARFGLSDEQLRHVLLDCDRPIGQFDGLASKGLWRVDQDKDPELRQTVLTLVAFDNLAAKVRAAGGDQYLGILAFLAQNDGEGWILPELLRLTDYGLGHDERARQAQPVASRLGPRFYDWQLAQSAEESWRECHLHARNLLGEDGYHRLLAKGEAGAPSEAPVIVSEPTSAYRVNPQGQLFR